jgi:hypothetical protein
MKCGVLWIGSPGKSPVPALEASRHIFIGSDQSMRCGCRTPLKIFSQHVIDIPGLDARDQVSQVVVTIPNVPGKFMPAYNSVNQKQH